MTEQILVLGLIILFAGIVLYFICDKTRDFDTGELPSMLQWAYLLVFIGFFVALSYKISLTAVLLLLLIITFLCWVVFKIAKKKNKDNDLFLYEQKWNLVEFLQGFFYISLFVFIFRTFLFEPFLVPSSSMRPGLVVGDFVLVNKYTYGIRMPISNKILVNMNKIKNGDVVVFLYDNKKNINYVKRAIGIPGDIVKYQNKKLYINNKEIDTTFLKDTFYFNDDGRKLAVKEYKQKINDKEFNIYIDENAPTLDLKNVVNINNPNCSYNEDGFECKIPENKYLMMGDNRDNSHDGRYFGFVDDIDIVGKPQIIWMNLKFLKRIGTFIE